MGAVIAAHVLGEYVLEMAAQAQFVLGVHGTGDDQICELLDRFAVA